MKLSNKLFALLLGVIMAVIAGAVTYGILSIALPSGHPAPQASCLDQVRGWAASSTKGETIMVGDVNAVSSDLQAVALDSSTASTSLVTADARTLQADTSTWQSDLSALRGNLPPECATGLHQSYSSALQDYSRSAGLIQAAASSIIAGNYAQGNSSLQQATILIDQGNALLGLANSDLKARTGQA